MQILDTDYQSYLMVYHCQEYQKMVSDKYEGKTQEEPKPQQEQDTEKELFGSVFECNHRAAFRLMLQTTVSESLSTASSTPVTEHNNTHHHTTTSLLMRAVDIGPDSTILVNEIHTRNAEDLERPDAKDGMTPFLLACWCVVSQKGEVGEVSRVLVNIFGRVCRKG